MTATTGGARVAGRDILALAACLLSACATPRVATVPVNFEQGRQVQLAIPFFPDHSDQCGPSALASVLEYWGKPETPESLRQDIYTAKLKGSLTIDLLLAAESRGLSAEILNASMARVRAELDAGHPLIAFVNAGYSFYPVGHYLVITGYDDRRQCLYAHSGMKRNQRISYSKFSRQWEKTGQWALLIQPLDPK